MAITSAQQTALVELYVAILDRAPLSEGLAFWAQVLIDNGGDLEYVATEMWNSAGAQADYPAFFTVEQIVAQVYENLLGRAPAADGLAFWVGEWNQFGPAQTMLKIIDNLNNNTSTDPQFLADQALFQNKVEFGKWVALNSDIQDPDLAKEASEMITSDPASIVEAQTFIDTDDAETVILTTGTDLESTGNNDDYFAATETTLNTSDSLDGDEGFDVLEVVQNGSGGFFAAPDLNSIELVTVTSGGSANLYGTIDVSDADGTEILETNENENIIQFTWADIQNVNGTSLSIVDTAQGTVNYEYDVNAYAGTDVADLTVAEVDCLVVNFMNETPNGAASNLDRVDIHSLINGQVNNTTSNFIWDLNVNDNSVPSNTGTFTTLNVDGDADLEIESVLDPTVTTVDASGLVAAGLTIDILGQGAVDGVVGAAGTDFATALTVTGGSGNDRIDVLASDNAESSEMPSVNGGIHGANGTFVLGEGDDTLRIGVNNDGADVLTTDPTTGEILSKTTEADTGTTATFGNQVVDSGAGDDEVLIHASGSQDVTTGTGDDTVTITGDVDNLLTTVAADGASVVATGDDNDTVVTHGDGDYTVTLGSGADSATILGAGMGTGIGDHNVDGGDGADTVTIDMVGDQTVTTGEGADSVTINGDGDQSVDTGTEADTVSITSVGDHTVSSGTGSDSILIVGNGDDIVDADAGSDTVTIIGDGDNTIDTGDTEDGDTDNDIVTVTGNGDNNVATGSGSDVVTITGDGDQTVDTGAAVGADAVTVTGIGIHNITTGDDADTVLVDGAWNADADLDFGTNDTTVISTGTGNDSVSVTANHRLDVDLGTGNDSLSIRAEDLSTDDTVAGGTGTDTLILTTGNAIVGQSETSDVSSIEIFDLRATGTTLVLTDNNYAGNENDDITVVTENSSVENVLPSLTQVNADLTIAVPADLQTAINDDLDDQTDNAAELVVDQGMSRADWDALVARWVAGEFIETYALIGGDWTLGAGYANDEEGLIDFLQDNGVDAVHFVDTNIDGDEFIADTDGPSPVAGDAADEVYFVTNQDPFHTVDITDVDLVGNNGRTFTLEGGNIRDVVIVDESALDTGLVLNFDETLNSDSTEDTLVIIDGAEVTAADLRNVDGLECIVLESESNAAQTWEIKLTDQIINQTTGLADLEILVDPEVPEGSKLTIIVDTTALATNTENGVVIHVNSNVDLTIENGAGVVDPADYGLYGITVVNQLRFTTNSDNLVGTAGADTFLAESLDQLEIADFAEGNGGDDTLLLDFSVFNATQSLSAQLNNAGIVEIETIRFVDAESTLKDFNSSATDQDVRFDGVGIADVESIFTGTGDDSIVDVDGDVVYVSTDTGDDFVDIDVAGTVNAGAGNDSLQGSGGDDWLIGGEGNDIFGGDQGGNDTIVAGNGTNSIADSTGDNSITAGDDSDTVTTGGGNDNISTGGSADSIISTGGLDTVAAGEGDNIVNLGAADAGADSVTSGTGADTITTGTGADVIDSGTGNDSIDSNAGADTVTSAGGNNTITTDAGADSVVTGSGNDTINSGADNDFVNAGEGNNSILTEAGNDTVVTGSGNDSISAADGDNSVVSAGGNNTVTSTTGADVITTGTGNDSIDSGDGNDAITTTGGTNTIDAGDGVDSVTGGTGADDITMGDELTAAEDIVGGTGADTVTFEAENTIVDADFVGVSGIEVFNFFGDGTGVNADDDDVVGDANFEANALSNDNLVGGISSVEVNGGAGDDTFDFSLVSSLVNIVINGDADNDTLTGGEGDDSIAGGTGDDWIEGSAGADQIALNGGGASDSDTLVYNNGLHGNLGGGAVGGEDTITGFELGDDRVLIDGTLELAIDGAANGIDLATNDNSADISAAGDDVLLYTGTGLTDADLSTSGFANVLTFLNPQIDTAGAGDGAVIFVHGATSTGMYFYQEDTGDNLIDASEMTLIGVFDNALVGVGDITFTP